METSFAPRPSANLTTQRRYRLVYTLADLLPRPLDHALEALPARNQRRHRQANGAAAGLRQ